MHLALKLAPVIAALVLSACGGGSGSEAPEPVTPPPPPAEIAPVTLIAGVATPVDYDWANPDPEVGCTDGAALGAKLNALTGPSRTGAIWTFARLANGDLLLAERGSCDGGNRIRVIHPAGNTIKTLAVGVRPPLGDTEALTSFLTPTSIAVAPSGDIYIGDSAVFNGFVYYGRDRPNQGPGIWKQSADGNISVLAGVRLPMTARVDGVGAAASFKFIGAMCYGSDGLLYVNDDGLLRTVSAAGAVTTVSNSSVAQSLVACGIDGSVLVSRRFVNNSANDDFYDPIAQKSIAKASVTGLMVFSNFNAQMVYFGPDNPSVLIFEGSSSSSYSGLAVVNLVDGSSETVAKFATADMPVDLTATPPVIDTPIAGVATGGKNFDILTGRSVIRFMRKP